MVPIGKSTGRRGRSRQPVAAYRGENKRARWRAASLLMVYVLMAAHFAHWKIAGKTLAPLELNEVMYTLELGIVTAGFIFMLVVVIATAVFGRFFCSWGCHILALQDLSAWALRRFGITPRPIRSRLLLWAPMIAAAYMFVWPQFSRVVGGEPMATLHLATDADGWASFTTENFWRNLPGPGITAITFFVCGFLIVYILGTRSFCSYGCPYGAVFGLADRIAAGRIRVGSDCIQCARCTAACTSHIRVHEEVERYGMVVNPACMKDLDCVSACPQQTLRYGFGRPSLFRRVLGTKEVKKLYTCSLGEEVLAAMVFVAAVLIYRGLYELVPFLMSLAFAAILSYVAIVATRLVRQSVVSFNRWRLRRSGALTRCGLAFLIFTVFAAAITIHSAVVRYSVFRGERLFNLAMAEPDADGDVADRAISHLDRAQSIGLIPMVGVERMLGDLYTQRLRWSDAVSSRRRSLQRLPHDPLIHEQLGYLFSRQGQYEEAHRYYGLALNLEPNRAQSHYGLAGVDFEMGRSDSAVRNLRRALEIKPDYPEAHYDLGAMLVEVGAPEEGIRHLRECVRLKPEFGNGHYNLAVALATRGALDDAMFEIERAMALQPDDEQTQRFRAFLISLVEISPGGDVGTHVTRE